jgi:hypothetical protein
LRYVDGSTLCEWKGKASYFDLEIAGERIAKIAWSYAQPTRDFTAIAGYMSFYPAKVECFIDEERVQPQPGGFYGGWITCDIVGPFKGESGTRFW